VKPPIHKVSIIGSGNVGSHLAIALHQANIDVTHISGRNTASNRELAKIVNAISCSVDALPEDQLVLICTPDDAIQDIVNAISDATPVAYTSGSVSINDLDNRDTIGVFYPLQTFTKSKELSLSEVPFFIESNDSDFAKQLFDLAKNISNEVVYADSAMRKKLHLTAVWVNNFTNHVIYQAQKYAESNEVAFEHLMPLLNETLRKLDDKTAFEAQTGPARRGDNKTIESHLSELDGLSKELYSILSTSIKKTYSND
jgi:predicted short-subunit dehydrogenase-like oxidoreductase (DUF2520 family)